MYTFHQEVSSHQHLLVGRIGEDGCIVAYSIFAGIKVFGISVVTDLGVEGKIVEVSHEEVQKAADAAQPKMTTIMRELINRA